MGVRRVVGPSAWIVGGAGLVIGVVAAWLVTQGNPGNMGLCVACFTRDTVSVFGGTPFNMAGFAYIRPELWGIVIGAAVTALSFREFRPRGGSAWGVRFVLGAIFIVSALIFLGCTVRAWLRLGAGDLNALIGVFGIVAGVFVGVFFLRKGFNLGRSSKLEGPSKALAWAMPALAVALVVLAVILTAGTSIAGLTWVEKGAALPGGSRAPLIISLIAGLAMGFVAQRSRFCTVGGIRDAVLVRRYDLLFGVFGLLIGVFVASVAFGTFKLGFEGQPAAHTMQAANFLSLAIASLAAVLAGGCPFRQMVMAAEGDVDSFGFIAGMGAGALAAHYFGIAATGAGITSAGWIAMAIMAVLLLGIAVLKSGLVGSTSAVGAEA